VAYRGVGGLMLGGGVTSAYWASHMRCVSVLVSATSDPIPALVDADC